MEQLAVGYPEILQYVLDFVHPIDMCNLSLVSSVFSKYTPKYFHQWHSMNNSVTNDIKKIRYKIRGDRSFRNKTVTRLINGDITIISPKRRQMTVINEYGHSGVYNMSLYH